MIRIVAAVVALLFLAGCGGGSGSDFAYDEAAHREAVKASLGVADEPDTARSDRAWERYKAEAEDRCAAEGDDFEAMVAVFADEGMLDSLRLDAEYVCPDKMPELRDALDILGERLQ